jgi:excisionase family DNA binding protein
MNQLNLLDDRRRASTGAVRLTADDVMTAREVARLLHAPSSTVEDWARRGVLPSVKVGRRRLYIRQRIEAVLTAEPKAQPPH